MADIIKGGDGRARIMLALTDDDCMMLAHAYLRHAVGCINESPFLLPNLASEHGGHTMKQAIAATLSGDALLRNAEEVRRAQTRFDVDSLNEKQKEDSK